jgi:hypothetical protein
MFGGMRVLVFLSCLLILMLLCSCGDSIEFNVEQLVKDQLTINKKDSVKIGACDSLLNEMREVKADTFRTLAYIPKDFEESLFQLDSMTTPEMKAVIKCLPDGDFSRLLHDNFGMYLRTNWGLWGDSKLAKNLYHMGVLHPDDMIGIILDSYQRKLKGEELDLKHQINHYHDHWKMMGTPVDSILTVIRNSGESMLLE